MQYMWRGVSAALVASTDMSFVHEAVQYCRVVQLEINRRSLRVELQIA